MTIVLNGTTGVTTPDVSTTTETISGGTANGVQYLNGSKAVTTGTALTFDGTNLATTGSATATKLIPTGTSVTGNGMYLPATNSVGISTAGANAVTIDASQNMGLSVTPSAWGSNYKVIQNAAGAFTQFNGGSIGMGQNFYDSGIAAFKYISTNAATYYYQNAGIHIWQNAPSGTAGNALTFTQAMSLDNSGGLILTGSTAQKATGTTWSNPSDQRIKDNIRNYNKGVFELMQVRVCEWEYNGKGGTVQGTKGLGVIADEIMGVLPDTVSTYDAKLNTNDEETTAIKKFDATEITWLLVKAIQEQQAIITQLQADVAALKGTP
jgi:adhesin HecA-like repeat protein